MHLNRQDDITADALIGIIALLGLVKKTDPNRYYINVKKRGYMYYGEPVIIRPLHAMYKNKVYPLGTYSQLVKKLMRDVKLVRTGVLI